MCPSTDDLQDWEFCGKTPRRVPAKQNEMRMYSVLPFSEDTFCIVWLVLSWKYLPYVGIWLVCRWVLFCPMKESGTRQTFFLLLDHFHGFAWARVDAFLFSCHRWEWLKFFGLLFPQGPDREDSKNLAMFKAVLKKNRDRGKGSKKDSGMWKIRRKNRRQTNTSYPKGLDTSVSVFGVH